MKISIQVRPLWYIVFPLLFYILLLYFILSYFCTYYIFVSFCLFCFIFVIHCLSYLHREGKSAGKGPGGARWTVSRVSSRVGAALEGVEHASGGAWRWLKQAGAELAGADSFRPSGRGPPPPTMGTAPPCAPTQLAGARGDCNI